MGNLNIAIQQHIDKVNESIYKLEIYKNWFSDKLLTSSTAFEKIEALKLGELEIIAMYKTGNSSNPIDLEPIDKLRISAVLKNSKYKKSETIIDKIKEILPKNMIVDKGWGTQTQGIHLTFWVKP